MAQYKQGIPKIVEYKIWKNLICKKKTILSK